MEGDLEHVGISRLFQRKDQASALLILKSLKFPHNILIARQVFNLEWEKK